MAYKIPITIEKFVEASKDGSPRAKNAADENEDKLKHTVDYYLDILNLFRFN